MSASINEFSTEEDYFVDRIRSEIQNGPTTRARKAILRSKILVLLNRPGSKSPQPLQNIENTASVTSSMTSDRNIRFREVLDDLCAWEVLDDQISLNRNNVTKDNDEFSDDQNDYWEDAFEYVDEEDSICLNDWDQLSEVEVFDGWEEIQQQTEDFMNVVEKEGSDEDAEE